ncbi:MAG: hypothetical protein ACFFB2_03455 [Promethearchaeota archaeon]
MSSSLSSPLSPELIGIWSSRAQSKYEKNIQLLFWISTGLIFFLLLIETINQISLVPVTAFLIAVVIVLPLEIYTTKLPHISIPISQGVVFIMATYIHFYNLFSQQQGFFDNPNYPLLPNLLDIFLGITILFRIIMGLELMKLNKWYQNARIPLSSIQEEALLIFESNLQLTSNKVRHEFIEEAPKIRVKYLYSHIFFCISLLMLLLIPLLLYFLLDVIIYPYILLIPGILISLLLIIYFSSKKHIFMRKQEY